MPSKNRNTTVWQRAVPSRSDSQANPPYSLVQVSSISTGRRVKTGSTGLRTYRFGDTGGEVGFGGTQGVPLSLRGRLFSFSWKAIVVS